MTEAIIVLGVVVVVAFLVGRSVYRIFSGKTKGCGCDAGCRSQAGCCGSIDNRCGEKKA